LGDLGVDGRIKLKRICGKHDARVYPSFNWFKIGSKSGPS